MSNRTIGDMVATHHAKTNDEVPYVPAEQNDRLKFHDFIHAAFNIDTNSGHGELVAAIYQSVFLNDLGCNPAIKAHQDHGDTVSLPRIEQYTLPHVKSFIDTHFLKESGKKTQANLSTQEVREHYHKAIIAKSLYNSKLQALGLADSITEVEVDALFALPETVAQEITSHVETSYQKLQKYAGNQTSPSRNL